MIVGWAYNELAAELDVNDVSMELYLPRPGTTTSKHVIRVEEEIIEAQAWGTWSFQDIVDGVNVGAGASVDATKPLRRGQFGTQVSRHAKNSPAWMRWEVDQIDPDVLDEFNALGSISANADILVAEADNRGGWFVGGAFTAIGGISKARCARVTAAGTTDSGFLAECDASVRAISLSPDGSYLAIGGSFTDYNGTAVVGLVIVDPNTGALIQGFTLGGTGVVFALHWIGNDLFVGGDYSSINSVNVDFLARLEFATSGWTVDSAWLSSPGDVVRAILTHGDKIYVGGDFVAIFGETRNHAAAMNIDDLELSDWDPNCNNDVYSINGDGDDIYLGGLFTQVNSVARTGLARVDAEYGELDADFTADVAGGGGLVLDIRKYRDELWIGGDFSTINGNASANFGRVAVDDGTWTAVSYNPNAAVTRIVESGPRVGVFGSFTTEYLKLFDGNRNFSPIGRYKFELELELSASENLKSVVWEISRNGNVIYTSDVVTEFKPFNSKVLVPGPDINLADPQSEYLVVATIIKNSGTEEERVGFGAYTTDAVYLIPIGMESGDQYDESDGLTMPSPGSNPVKAGNTYTLSLPTQADTPSADNDHYFYRLFAILGGPGGNQITIDRAGASDILMVPATNLYQAEIDWNDKGSNFTLTITFDNTLTADTVSDTATHPAASSNLLNPDQIQIEREVRVGGTLTGPQFGRWVSDWMPVPAGFSVAYANQGNTSFEYRYRCRYRDFRRDGVEDQRGPVAVTTDWSDWTSWI